MAKIGKLIIERKTGAEVKAQKQAQIDTIRRGGFGKTADRAQKKLDKKGW